MKPKVSVIIPVYNAEQYIRRCINSIINQTLKNIEIIIIDDGSTDNSFNLCIEFANKDNRVKVFHQENSGQGSARNKGLDISVGDYITFVDSDDFVNINMLEDLLSIAITYDADLVQCKIKEVYDNTVEFEHELFNVLDRKIVIDSNQQGERLLCYNTDDVTPVNKLFRRELFNNNFRFPLNTYFEDKHLMMRVRHKAKKIVYIDTPYYYYYQSPNSTMRSGISAKWIDSLIFVGKDMVAYCKENNLLNNYLAEQSGFFRMLLSSFYKTYKNPALIKQFDTVKMELKNNIPLFIQNKKMSFPYRILAKLLYVNFNTIYLFIFINKIKKLLKIKTRFSQ